MDEQYRQAFIEETGETIAELETSLLDLEQAPQDGELIGRVFRAMHTMKGSSSMFGHDSLAQFTHEVESIFDLVRNDLIPVDKEFISLSLEAVDHIKCLFTAFTDGITVDPNNGRAIIERLKVLEPDSASTCSPPLPTIEEFLGILTEYETSRLRANLNKKRHVFSARQTYPLLSLDTELQAIKELLKDEGELLSTVPRQYPVPPGFIGFEVLFASAKEQGLLEKILGTTLSEVDCTVVVVDKRQSGGIERQQTPLTYRLRFQPPPAIDNGNSCMIAFRKLHDLGRCSMVAHLDSIPPLEAFDPELCPITFDIILTSKSGQEAIKAVFSSIDGDYHLQIEVIDDGCGKGEDCHRKLGEILLERGDLDQAELQEVLSEQKRIGELLVEKGFVRSDHIHSALVEQQHLQELHRERQGQLTPGGTIRVSTEKLDSLVNLVGQLVTVQARLSEISSQALQVEGLYTVAEEVERLAAEIRDSTLSIRMLPIGTTFAKFVRLVRDLSAELGKEIDLATSGAETELDKTVLEKLSDPLVHIIRNCIDHGIEAPEIREGAGKSRRGTIMLEAAHSGDSVVISISDDGAGLDLLAIRAKAVEQRLISPTVDLAEQDIINLIFAPGFSTAGQVTSVSGRGVGMDVVKRSIESFRGSIGISTTRGKGMTITIRIPLTLAIIDSLLVQIGNVKFVLPLASVHECIDLSQRDIAESHGREMANVRGQLVPYIPLRTMFHMVGQIPSQQLVVIVNHEGKRIGLVVDSVIGEHQTVIKSLGKLYRDVRGLSGATIMGDGSVALILDIAQIVGDARAHEHVTEDIVRSPGGYHQVQLT